MVLKKKLLQVHLTMAGSAENARKCSVERYKIPWWCDVGGMSREMRKHKTERLHQNPSVKEDLIKAREWKTER